MVLALMVCNGIASGKQVDAHIIVSKYWLPFLVLGKGPTQSIITLLKGLSKAGIGFNGAFGIPWFGLPTIRQTWQVRQNFYQVFSNTWPIEMWHNLLICLINSQMTCQWCLRC